MGRSSPPPAPAARSAGQPASQGRSRLRRHGSATRRARLLAAYHPGPLRAKRRSRRSLPSQVEASSARSTGCWASAFWTLLSGSLAFEANQPNTELFINLLLILGFGVVAQLRPGRRSLGLCLTAGLLVGIASLFKQVVVAWFLAVGVAYLIHHRKSPTFWRQTGTQALVKVAMLQGICDRQAEMLDSWHNPMSGVAVV